MKPAILLFGLLLLAPPDLSAAQDQDPCDALVEAYDRAAFRYRRAERAAKKEGSELEAPHPVVDFYPRFEILGKTGEGRALAWMVLHAPLLELDEDELAGRLAAMVRELTREYAEAAWMEGLLPKLARQERWVGAERIDACLAALFERNASAEVRAEAGLKLAGRLREAEPLRAKALYERILAEFPGSRQAAQAETRLGTLSLPIVPGVPAPDFVASDVDGNELALADFRGRVVLVVFWGFWSAACRAELAHLKALVASYPPDDLAVVGVSADTDADEFRRLCREHGVSWPNAWEGTPAGPLVRLWRVRRFPTIHVLDHEGRIRFTEASGETLERAVATLVAELPAEEAPAEPPRNPWPDLDPTHPQAPAVSDVAVPAAAPVPPSPLSFEELEAEHAAAERAWREEPGASGEAERERPTRAFVPRFEALAKGGDGRAKAWLLENLASLPGSPAERGARGLGLFEELLRDHAEAPWFARKARGAVERLWSDGGDPRGMLAAVHRFLHGGGHDAAARAVAYATAGALARAPRDEADVEAAAELFEYVVERWPGDPRAASARGKLFRLRNLRVGGTAPELAGEDVDGNELRLSELRGKVVVIDFWGFW